MKIYLADIASVLPRHREYISPQRLQKTLRYRMPDDQKRCIAGSVLLRYFLGDTAILDNGFGKPVAENGVCFNLSHSGGWVLLAVDDRDVGCDIESVCFVDAARMGKIVFTGTVWWKPHPTKRAFFLICGQKKKPCSNVWARAFTARQSRWRSAEIALRTEK